MKKPRKPSESQEYCKLDGSNVETNNRFKILNVSEDDRSIGKKSSTAKGKKANKQSRENLSGNRRPTTTPKSQTGKAASTRQDKDGSTTTVIVGDSLTKHLDARTLKRSIKKGNQKIFVETYKGANRALRHDSTQKKGNFPISSRDLNKSHLNFQEIFIIDLVEISSPVSMTTRSRDSLAAILDKKYKSFLRHANI